MARATFQAGAPCWIDLMTSNVQTAQEFYGPLLGWEFQTGDAEKYGGYVMAHRNGLPVAGLMQKQPDMAGMPDVWTTYLGTTAADVSSGRALEAGGSVLFPPMDIPEQGVMGLVADTRGAAIGLWEPRPMSGFELRYEPGAPYWHELFTRDFAGAQAFYREAFGWDITVVSDTDEFRYATLGKDAESKAGIMDASAFLPEGVPDHWRVYLGVEDAVAAAARVQELGGSLLSDVEDTPYGTVVSVADPGGAMVILASGYPGNG